MNGEMTHQQWMSKFRQAGQTDEIPTQKTTSDALESLLRLHAGRTIFDDPDQKATEEMKCL